MTSIVSTVTQYQDTAITNYETKTTVKNTTYATTIEVAVSLLNGISSPCFSNANSKIFPGKLGLRIERSTWSNLGGNEDQCDKDIDQ